MSIAVTAATGQLGRLVIDALLDRVPAGQIVAVARNADKAASFAAKGVEVKIASYDDPASLQGAFSAGDTVLLISSTEFGKRTTQHRNVIEAAKAAGVARLVYTSVLGGFLTGGFKLAEEQHKPTEQAIHASGLTYTLLRNGWYTENYTDQIPVQLEHGLVGTAGEGRIGSASRADLAAAAAVVLTSSGHDNKAYELSGDSAWTFSEYAAELSRQTGRQVAYNDVPLEILTEIYVTAGLPREPAEAFAESHLAIRRGLFAGGSGELRRLIGRPTICLADSISAALAGRVRE
ncbi:SDR family oxidoreductase [Paraburkholderia strydomiana]|uniref:SDR family oxidoreductase n=1 Tax=Paraburkholderia strydomiana TaxID=1245417 RepID=UPI0038BAAE7A